MKNKKTLITILMVIVSSLFLGGCATKSPTKYTICIASENGVFPLITTDSKAKAKEHYKFLSLTHEDVIVQELVETKDTSYILVHNAGGLEMWKRK